MGEFQKNALDSPPAFNPQQFEYYKDNVSKLLLPTGVPEYYVTLAPVEILKIAKCSCETRDPLQNSNLGPWARRSVSSTSTTDDPKLLVCYGQELARRTEIQHLRQLLEQCDLCSGIRRESCQSNPPPCFQGVACQDTREGVRCGHCPRGYVGDGRTCTPGTTCEEKPCFSGTHTTNITRHV
ncbi:unnamed protein product [Timema podura]|uniref:Uncharacterized protein n=1 Tax=Timema podura TaxID=61482 RepID=A0ABN7NVE0_TIMPD|nr:unnamed protein product [Timema podura]